MDGEENIKVTPEDTYNQALVANVHPNGWKNPEPRGRYNLVVVGAGTAGLVTAAGAAGLGARVALVERHLLGGDCLNYGCVPSKALIRASRSAHDVGTAARFGIRTGGDADVDFGAVMERMRRLRSELSFHDSAERFRDLGVDVYLGSARFLDTDALEAGGKTLQFSRAVIATGARAIGLPIAGLAEAGYLTNETVFSLTGRPARLAVIGGGPLGSEMAQTFHRLGSKVTVFEMSDHLLGREDSDAAEILQNAFIREGIQLMLRSKPLEVTLTDAGKLILFERQRREESIVVDEILIGVGRAPNVEGLNLEAAEVRYDEKYGVFVDDYLRTTNPRIYAAGDVCLPYKFTHMADASARIVIQNALFRGRKKWSSLTIPWTTYTDPEVAHVGMYEREAAEKGIEVDTFVRPLKEVDRAVLDGEEEGFVKVNVKKGSDKILGATIVARHAGEMISEISLAMVGGLGLKTIANVIHPYPTQAEAIKQTADLYNRTRLTPLLAKAFRFWLGLVRLELYSRSRGYWHKVRDGISRMLSGFRKK